MSKNIKKIAIVGIGAGDYIALANQFPLAITAEAKEDKAEIRISGVIHEWRNSASWFREQIQKFNEDGIKKASLYINTPGGDVFQAAEIRNELDAFEGTINGYGGAMVASAGTYIRLGCDDFEMVANGQWMYHKPMGVIRGNEDEWESQLVLLKNITSEYRKGYAALTGINEEEIEKKWAKGDVWLNAQQAKKEGFITGISKYKTKITEKETAMFSACGSPFIPPLSKPKSKTETEMNTKLTAMRLGMDENSTEEQINARLDQLKKDGDKAKQLELDAKQKEEAKLATDIKALQEKAIAEKKMTAKQVESTQKWAETDFAGWKAYVEGLQPISKISEQIKGKNPATVAALKDKEFEAMTEDEQEQLLSEDREAFQAKYEAYASK
ncbi:MAG: ATP-dependent Clp protease proteolytic subunit [Leeuwenhoekiella sp.]